MLKGWAHAVAAGVMKTRAMGHSEVNPKIGSERQRTSSEKKSRVVELMSSKMLV